MGCSSLPSAHQMSHSCSMYETGLLETHRVHFPLISHSMAIAAVLFLLLFCPLQAAMPTILSAVRYFLLSTKIRIRMPFTPEIIQIMELKLHYLTHVVYSICSVQNAFLYSCMCRVAKQ